MGRTRIKVAIERKMNKKKTELKVIKIPCLRLDLKFQWNALVIYLIFREGLRSIQIYGGRETLEEERNYRENICSLYGIYNEVSL